MFIPVSTPIGHMDPAIIVILIRIIIIPLVISTRILTIAVTILTVPIPSLFLFPSFIFPRFSSFPLIITLFSLRSTTLVNISGSSSSAFLTSLFSTIIINPFVFAFVLLLSRPRLVPDFAVHLHTDLLLLGRLLFLLRLFRILLVLLLLLIFFFLGLLFLHCQHSHLKGRTDNRPIDDIRPYKRYTSATLYNSLSDNRIAHNLNIGQTNSPLRGGPQNRNSDTSSVDWGTRPE